MASSWWKKLIGVPAEVISRAELAALPHVEQAPPLVSSAPLVSIAPTSIVQTELAGYHETKSEAVVGQAAEAALKQMRSGPHYRRIGVFWEVDGKLELVVPLDMEPARPEDDWHEDQQWKEPKK